MILSAAVLVVILAVPVEEDQSPPACVFLLLAHLVNSGGGRSFTLRFPKSQKSLLKPALFFLFPSAVLRGRGKMGLPMPI